VNQKNNSSPVSNSSWLKGVGEYKWSLGAAAFLLLGMLSARGGAHLLVGLLRFALPLILILFIFKLLKKKLFGAAGAAFKKQMEAMMQAGQAGSANGGDAVGRKNPENSQNTITLCSKCGSYLTAGHRCKS
jgi:hypothetical protein